MNVDLPSQAQIRRRELGVPGLLLVLLTMALGPLAYAGLVEGEVLITTRLRIAHFKGADAALASGMLLALVLLPVAWLVNRNRWRRHIVFMLFSAVAVLVAVRMWQLSS